MQRVVLRPLPVIFACAGCPEFGYSAPRAAQALERRGQAEMAWLGAPGPKPLARFPCYSLDACERRCAQRWLEERGVQVQLAFVLDPLERLEPERAAARIAAGG
jgi:uncharacterized metal-binding protein